MTFEETLIIVRGRWYSTKRALCECWWTLVFVSDRRRTVVRKLSLEHAYLETTRCSNVHRTLQAFTRLSFSVVTLAVRGCYKSFKRPAVDLSKTTEQTPSAHRVWITSTKRQHACLSLVTRSTRLSNVEFSFIALATRQHMLILFMSYLIAGTRSACVSDSALVLYLHGQWLAFSGENKTKHHQLSMIWAVNEWSTGP